MVFFEGESEGILIYEMEHWKKTMESLVSGPIAEREEDKRQCTDIQRWILYDANEF